MAPHNEDWSPKTGRRHSHDLIMCPNHFPGCWGWGLTHRVVSSQQTVSVPTNRVKSASRYTWSSFQQRVYSHDSHVCPSPSFKATAQQQSRPKTCCPLPARATKRPAGSPRVEHPRRTLEGKLPLCPQAGMNHSSCNLGLLAPPLLQVTVFESHML